MREVAVLYYMTGAAKWSLLGVEYFIGAEYLLLFYYERWEEVKKKMKRCRFNREKKGKEKRRSCKESINT